MTRRYICEVVKRLTYRFDVSADSVGEAGKRAKNLIEDAVVDPGAVERVVVLHSVKPMGFDRW